ncbi:MAG TPA: threonine/serine dehydratase, partial [Planctomycetota bacterium]|nr:threonine/serine dehydratase [Planctomycetota bacterium]
KCENLQRTGAFKIRGAYHRISKLPKSCKGVTASSSGNHAQAVALAARMRGIKACIVMLDQSVPHKVEGTRSYGAEVILGGSTSVVITERAEREAAERGWVFVPPFNDPDIIAGQGTVGLEIVQDLRGVRSVIVQIGGGGLSSGVMTAVKESNPKIKIFGVEPAGAAKMRAALDAGRVVTLPEVKTIADGLKPTRVSELTLEHVSKYADDVVGVDDADILDTARHLLLQEKLVVEPSGAAALAAVRAGKLKLPKGPAVAILSGGNADVRMILDSPPGGALRA